MVLYGDSGTGKSALAKTVLDNAFPDWRQVWLGPDQLSTALSDIDRPKLNLAHPLDQILKHSSKPNNVLVLDSVERLPREAQAGARSLVAAISAASADLTTWQVIVIGQTEAWAENALQAVANVARPAHHEVRSLSPNDVEAALYSAPELSWAASHGEIVAALGNLRTLAWVLGAENRFGPNDAHLLGSYTAIADHLWRYWSDGKVQLQNLLIRFAERNAKFEHSFAISQLDPADAATFDQRPDQAPLTLNSRNRIEFQHDLAAEWARFQRLKEISDQPEQWATYAANPMWLGALRMLGSFLLRQTKEGGPAWDAALKTLTAQPTEYATDVLLDALCLDPSAEPFLMARADLLLKDHGHLLNRLLKRFLHVATAPGGTGKILADATVTDPSFALYIEAQFRVPIVARWPLVGRFLAANRERVAGLILPAVSALCEKWLSSVPHEIAPGVPAPFRNEFAEVALATARALQLESKKDTILVGDFGKVIYSAALAAAPDLPDQVSEWALEMVRRRPFSSELKQKIAAYRREKARKHQERLQADPK